MLQDEKFITIVIEIMNYTDAHCHIITNAPCPDILMGRICNATTQSEWDKISTISDDKQFACIGVHPWYIASITPDWQSDLYNRLKQNPLLMVGEIGIDKYHDNISAQEEIFITQLKIASELNRPVHLHCVGAWDKILHIFKVLHKSMPPIIVAHAFNGDTGIIQQLADQYNVYFSYSTPQDAKAATRIAETPTSRLLTESDAYDNESEIESIELASNAIANIFGQEIDAITTQIYQNFQKVISYVRPID